MKAVCFFWWHAKRDEVQRVEVEFDWPRESSVDALLQVMQLTRKTYTPPRWWQWWRWREPKFPRVVVTHEYVDCRYGGCIDCLR